MLQTIGQNDQGLKDFVFVFLKQKYLSLKFAYPGRHRKIFLREHWELSWYFQEELLGEAL